jgi:hypothetical protein
MADPITPSGEGSAAAADAASFEAEMTEMSAEALPPPAPPTQSEPTGTTSTPSAVAPLEGQAATGKPTATDPSAPGAPTTAPAPAKKYTVMGKDYTLEELDKAGLLDQMGAKFTAAEQVSHYQRELEKSRQAEEARAAQPPQADPGPTPEALAAAYTPVMRQAVEAGIVEEDAVNAYPKMASRMFYLSDIVQSQGQILNAVLGWARNVAQGGRAQAVQTTVGQLSDQVAQDGPLFADLGKPDERSKFWNWVGETYNPPASSLTKEMVAGLWTAYRHREFMGVAQTAIDIQKAADEEKRRNAAPEGGGPRGGPSGAPNPFEAEMDEMAAEVLPPRRR